MNKPIYVRRVRTASGGKWQWAKSAGDFQDLDEVGTEARPMTVEVDSGQDIEFVAASMDDADHVGCTGLSFSSMTLSASPDTQQVELQCDGESKNNKTGYIKVSTSSGGGGTK